MKTLKSFFYLSLISLFIWSCSSIPQKNTSAKEKPVVIENDSLEYQVIIIDPGFTSYLSTRAKPMNFHTLEYLEAKNKRYVTTWNSRVINPASYDSNIYGMSIDYDHKINYGLEVNYKLYWYFKFAEEKYRMRLD